MVIQKDVAPQGYLLNDNDIGVDHLGEFTYADALAESIHQVDTPITIGIFARWGTGKSFLLRHLESILKRFQRQDSIDDAKKERSGEGGHIKTSRIVKTMLWALCVILLFGIFVVTVILAIQPEIFWSRSLSEDEHTGPVTSTVSYVNATTALPDAEESEAARTIRIIKIAALVMIPIEIAVVFLVGCCGNTWLSATYYGSFRLITYGTFTKLPTRNKQHDIVEDPGQDPAEILKYIRAGDERLAIAASESVVLSRRYIFVDFKAWEYAGSDTLWAGIVTKLSDAIEAEFGVITARLFRMLHVEEIPKNRLDVSDRTLYAKFSYLSDEKEITDMVRQYGVVTNCKKVSSVVREEGFEYWKVTYSNEGEFRSARDCLRIEGVDLQTYPPTEEEGGNKEDRSPNLHRGGPVRSSGRPLINNGDTDIEMQPMNPEPGCDVEDEEVLKFKLPPKSRCCSRFCIHFIRYPVMTLCLPRLVWWILILVCCVCIPIVVYIIADFLGLDVFRTYRTVPVAGQVLLWLPASSAVTVVAGRFLWAMCHSQRQRINRALDGTKTKMAEQLGFMDKIKTEIAVISKLIHCARFTHQQDFKVIITIDDLDRVPLEKVKAVLEAVNILLSDKSSPFVCLIAVDPRIVVKCIEEGMGAALIKANVTGHEYLKKIINLPICLPEVGNPGKRRFIAGLIDQADHSVTYRAAEGRTQEPERREENNLVSLDGANAITERDGSSEDELDGASPGDLYTVSEMTTDGARPSTRAANRSSPDIPRRREVLPRRKSGKVELDHKKFLFECRKFIYGDKETHKHLVGNPRNIKRIFNTISLTACIINCFVRKQQRRRFIHSHRNEGRVAPGNRKVERLVRTRKLAKDLVRWIILTDQWPYRTSYILQVIEDADQRKDAGIVEEGIPDDMSIFDIFQNKVVAEFKSADRSLLGLDADPEVFYSYIGLLGRCGFTKRRIAEMQKHTVNLDYSIRHSIAFERDLSCMDPPESEKKVEGVTRPTEDAANAPNPATDHRDEREETRQVPTGENVTNHTNGETHFSTV